METTTNFEYPVLFKKLIYTGTIECLTGLLIGDKKERDLGGVDLSVIRRKDDNTPYIPGSSVKGKMRCLLEQVHGTNQQSKFFNEGDDICLLFGALENKDEIRKEENRLKAAGKSKAQIEEEIKTFKLQFQDTPSRIIVRDAKLTEEAEKWMRLSEYLDRPYSEVKNETAIDRVLGKAKGGSLRQIERVPAGASFDIQIILNVFARSKEAAQDVESRFVRLLKDGILLLNYDYLGGNGSRGYGRIHFELNFDDPKELKREDFVNVQAEEDAA